MTPADPGAAVADDEATSTVIRAFDVIASLALLTREGQGASATDVARALGRERSHVSRTLAALADQDVVARDAGRRYRLSWAWYTAAEDLVDRRLRLEGLSVLDELAATTGEAVFLGVLRGDTTVTIVESVPAVSRMIGTWVGRAYPAFCSDAGQAVLWDAPDDEVRAVFAATAFESEGPRAPRSVDDFLTRLHAARERGYTIVDEEAEAGLYSVAAPVWDFRGEVVAAVQVVGERAVLQPRTAGLADACLTAAATLSTRLGHGIH
ncbi:MULTISPECIES: IclR family transcriptional regulator [Microbacterium]|uniref:IclR family transcriptional regulator n=1 Tax=Microbacterium TaxID=33882 RepID=UPI002782C877|nr:MULTISPECIES: IclR family transcriptional regulator [Microbacterium]MDQ1075727.1 IclR family pca regulon transcriptional regulator [Microbacterium sp. SORGH_AS_0969]MDQ1115970.1 IclR family pca regulon transcriptional regulator [Microbacterium testaceum]